MMLVVSEVFANSLRRLTVIIRKRIKAIKHGQGVWDGLDACQNRKTCCSCRDDCTLLYATEITSYQGGTDTESAGFAGGNQYGHDWKNNCEKSV